MSRVATLWALARNEGPPAADDKALDGDVIPAAQAEAAGATVVTENVSHRDRSVAAADQETLFQMEVVGSPRPRRWFVAPARTELHVAGGRSAARPPAAVARRARSRRSSNASSGFSVR